MENERRLSHFNDNNFRLFAVVVFVVRCLTSFCRYVCNEFNMQSQFMKNSHIWRIGDTFIHIYIYKILTTVLRFVWKKRYIWRFNCVHNVVRRIFEARS